MPGSQRRQDGVNEAGHSHSLISQPLSPSSPFIDSSFTTIIASCDYMFLPAGCIIYYHAMHARLALLQVLANNE